MRNHSEIKDKIRSLEKQKKELEIELENAPSKLIEYELEIQEAKKEGDENTSNLKVEAIENLKLKMQEWKLKTQEIFEEINELRIELK